MKTNRRLFVTIVCVMATLSNIVVVAGQERRVQVVPPEGNRVWVGGGPGQIAMAGAQGDSTFVFVSSEMSIDGKVVKGAPYSAQAVNESVQTLVGGNRIVRQSTATIYRDSEGRTRREQAISVVGGFSAEGGPTQTTFINDPVASVNYILDVKNRTARKIDYSAKIAAEKMLVDTMKAKRSSAEGGAAGGVEKTPPEKAAVIAELKARRAAEAGPAGEATEKIVVEKAAAAGEFRYEMRTGGGPPPVFAGQGPAGFVMMGNKKNTRKEELGKQTVEGVEAEGTRYTTTIPAGEIGNEQPIEMVQESWFSPELQTLVMSKHSDPRFGESTYRLTNINRGEQPRSLFEVPSDYTIQEAGPKRRPGNFQESGPPVEMRRKIELEKRRPGSEQ